MSSNADRQLLDAPAVAILVVYGSWDMRAILSPAGRRFALEPLAELDPGLRPCRNCADQRTVTVADLLPSVADQEVMRIGGPDWADR